MQTTLASTLSCCQRLRSVVKGMLAKSFTGEVGGGCFYRASARLLVARRDLEAHLRERERDLFNLDRTIVLYDLTNTYFEGVAADNELARRSAASKEKRTDCPLISVGLVLDAEGFVLTHRVFPGNVSDCRTLLDAVGELREVGGMGPSKRRRRGAGGATRQ
ncbi:MAG: hypothetical protein HN380_03355 [Victivallales bacterium]|nr:hypothetical protein [Victivallales bacterium]